MNERPTGQSCHLTYHRQLPLQPMNGSSLSVAELGEALARVSTPHIPSLARSRQLVGNLMANTSTIACFGSRALLSLFVSAAPEPASVLAAVTTEEEGVEQVLRHRPVFLFATETLEGGDGLSLVRRTHEELPR